MRLYIKVCSIVKCITSVLKWIRVILQESAEFLASLTVQRQSSNSLKKTWISYCDNSLWSLTPSGK